MYAAGKGQLGRKQAVKVALLAGAKGAAKKGGECGCSVVDRTVARSRYVRPHLRKTPRAVREALIVLPGASRLQTACVGPSIAALDTTTKKEGVGAKIEGSDIQNEDQKAVSCLLLAPLVEIFLSLRLASFWFAGRIIGPLASCLIEPLHWANRFWRS